MQTESSTAIRSDWPKESVGKERRRQYNAEESRFFIVTDAVKRVTGYNLLQMYFYKVFVTVFFLKHIIYVAILALMRNGIERSHL